MRRRDLHGIYNKSSIQPHFEIVAKKFTFCFPEVVLRFLMIFYDIFGRRIGLMNFWVDCGKVDRILLPVYPFENPIIYGF